MVDCKLIYEKDSELKVNSQKKIGNSKWIREQEIDSELEVNSRNREWIEFEFAKK